MKSPLFALAAIALSFSVFASTESPYMGQEARDIKALSQQQVDDYLKGAGMGYAKAAELNRYPGPRHVLDLSNDLELSDEQIARTQALFDAMKSEAMVLGQQLVAKEQDLDRRFASSSIDPPTLSELLAQISVLQARIRFVHLNAHLQQRPLLTVHQMRRYEQLRGYGKSGQHDHGH